MHALSVTVSGKDMAELQQNMTQLLKVISFSTASVEIDEDQNADGNVVQIEKKSKRVHKVNTKKSKSDGATAANEEVNTAEDKSPINISQLREEAAAPAIEEQEQQPAATAPLTFADVRNALKELVEVGESGTKVGHEILTAFSVQRISQLKEEDYAAFVAKVKEALGKL